VTPHIFLNVTINPSRIDLGIELLRQRKLKFKSSVSKTDPFEERISKFALRQGPRFEISLFVLYLRGSREEWEGGGGGERERIGGREPVKPQ